MSILTVLCNHPVAAALIITVVYVVSLGIHRLYISPLAKFPGPKLAALTQWYETYFELFKGDGGQFIFEYAKWHEKYGPIIRISPWELHIQDSEFYEVLYSATRSLDKPGGQVNRSVFPLSTFSTPGHALHRRRRSALNPLFSRRRIAEHQPNIQRLMDNLCDRLTREFLGKDKVLTVDKMWGCWTSDNVVEYSFERHYIFIEHPEFQSFFVEAIESFIDPVHVFTQFPWVTSLLISPPDCVVRFLQPRLRSVLDFKQEIKSQITELLGKPKSEKQPTTIFSALLESDLPTEERSPEHLQDEAMTIIGGAIEPTTRALTLATYHIIANPEVYQRLREELIAAIPDPKNIPPWDNLTQLPYLSACIEEALRLSYGSSQRLPRILRTTPLQYKNYTIPINTTVGMTSYTIAHDERIFPDSFNYHPERWLGTPRAPPGKQLSRYMVTFGRGARSCAGMWMAYAEIYTGVASLFRRFEMELCETGREAVDLYMDWALPRVDPKSRGVRVFVRRVVGG
ncbi:cytochrome P450 [Aspergillus stella-maris]|uniref:cytochrome P450 n=1 Tax=Aspergillus stella-maris TaxID=1810926 RepID=UPI003CCD9002